MAKDELALDFLEPPQREYLRKQAEKRRCSVEDVIKGIVEQAMGPGSDREERPTSIMDFAGIISDDEVSGESPDEDTGTTDHNGAGKDPLDKIVGMIETDGKVTGENFHDYLYGRGDQE